MYLRKITKPLDLHSRPPNRDSNPGPPANQAPLKTIPTFLTCPMKITKPLGQNSGPEATIRHEHPNEDSKTPYRWVTLFHFGNQPLSLKRVGNHRERRPHTLKSTDVMTPFDKGEFFKRGTETFLPECTQISFGWPSIKSRRHVKTNVLYKVKG